jgi:hypothetical protein
MERKFPASIPVDGITQASAQPICPGAAIVTLQGQRRRPTACIVGLTLRFTPRPRQSGVAHTTREFLNWRLVLAKSSTMSVKFSIYWLEPAVDQIGPSSKWPTGLARQPKFDTNLADFLA